MAINRQFQLERDTEKKEATENLHDDQVVDHALIPYDSNP